MSILISQPVHFIFDIIFVITASIHVHDIQDLARSTLKCGLQWVILTLVTALLVVLSSKLLYAVLYGRIVFVVVHLIFVLLVDQVRNFLVQSLIWFLLQRRCGQVPLMDE